MRLAIVLTVLMLLMLVAASAEAAKLDYVLRLQLTPIELADRTPLVLDEEKGEALGGLYRLSLTGNGNPFYGNGLFLLPNETGVVELRLEVLRAPSGYRLAVNGIWMNPRWCDVHFELTADGYTKPIRGRALEFYVRKFVTQEKPLSIRLLVKPYAFKELLPYGWIESCVVDMEISGNISFGANVRKVKWSMAYLVHVLKPEDGLEVQIERPLLAFGVRRERDPITGGDYLTRIILKAGLGVRNNLEGDVVLEKIEFNFLFGPKSPETTSRSYELELNRILKPGQAENIRLEEEWGEYIREEVWKVWGNGTLMIKLHYLWEKGKGIKRFFYAFDLRGAEKISPQAVSALKTTTSKAHGYTATQASGATVSTASATGSRPGGLPIFLGDWGRIVLNPVTILLVLGLVFSIACLVARRGGKERRGAGEAEAGPRPPPLPPPALPPPPESPPPSPRRGAPIIPRPQAREAIPRWVYGECLKIMEGKYREFRRLRESGELRYALYALHDGLEAALKLYAKAARLITLEDEKRMTLGDVLKLLSQRHLISEIEDRLIRQVIEIRNRYKHIDLTTEPDKKIVDNCGVAYEVVMREFRKRYSPLPPEEQG